MPVARFMIRPYAIRLASGIAVLGVTWAFAVPVPPRRSVEAAGSRQTIRGTGLAMDDAGMLRVGGHGAGLNERHDRKQSDDDSL